MRSKISTERLTKSKRKRREAKAQEKTQTLRGRRLMMEQALQPMLPSSHMCNPQSGIKKKLIK